MKRLVLAMLLVGCTNDGSAKRILEDHGYENIELKGHSWNACSKDDDSNTEFVADAPFTHKRVNGVVCCGWLKGCTIRFED